MFGGIYKMKYVLNNAYHLFSKLRKENASSRDGYNRLLCWNAYLFVILMDPEDQVQRIIPSWWGI